MGSDAMAGAQIASLPWMEALVTRANQDGEMAWALQGLEGSLLLDMESQRHLLRLGQGRIELARSIERDDSWDLALAAPLDIWTQLFSATPPPNHQGLTALWVTQPHFAAQGDQHLFASALHALNRLVELGREPREPTPAPDPPVRRDPGQIIGHYLDLPAPGTGVARVYYEEAGSGPPLVLLHTAGADSRQFHELLADVEIAKHWRMLAFDLPRHGKSIPSPGWEQSPYRLTTSDYAHWCVQFMRQAAKGPALVMGCSMGGAMAYYLAARHRQEVAAAICLEAPDRSPGRRNRFLSHAGVNQATYVPSYVYNLMSPASPSDARHRAWWYYSQGGPGVYQGDLWFYSQEWDAAQVSPQMDPEACPVVLLTGEYDYSASPQATRRLAKQAPGVEVEIMSGMGHFPMTEDPDRFRSHLLPVLARLRPVVAD